MAFGKDAIPPRPKHILLQYLGRIDQFDAALMAAAFERGFEPDADNLQGHFFGHHTLSEGDDVGVIVLTA